MHTRTLGRSGLTVSALGLGCMGTSEFYGAGDDDESIAVIHRAIELNQVMVAEIMSPRGKIISLPSDMPIEAASAKIVDEQHSRVPVYDAEQGRDHIIGVIYSKDVARLMHFRGVAAGMGVASARGEYTVTCATAISILTLGWKKTRCTE